MALPALYISREIHETASACQSKELSLANVSRQSSKLHESNNQLITMQLQKLVQAHVCALCDPVMKDIQGKQRNIRKQEQITYLSKKKSR